jgi:hypothetical protein
VVAAARRSEARRQATLQATEAPRPGRRQLPRAV